MIDVLRQLVVKKYEKLCRKLKINNWQKEVFMSNAVEIMVKLEDRIEKLEKENKDLKSRMEELNLKKK